MKSVAVFCGSSKGNDPVFEEAAWKLGEALAHRNIELVYGGTRVGLMGILANGALSKGGKVTGVLPEILKEKEIAHPDITSIHYVGSMHERKAMMNELCDGVIALPGGFGTMDELFEMLTWSQLGLHTKPIAILNVNGFYNSLLSIIKTMTENGFLKNIHSEMVIAGDDIAEVLHRMENYVAPRVEKWINRHDT